jgi:hypothetical protein
MKIIFAVTFFNLLFEYSLRGFNNLQTQPFLPVVLFSIYFTLYIMVEDLILRFKLKDYQLMILSFFYGTIYCAYTSGIAFINPTFMGVAWVPLILVNLIWWGTVQAVVAFYLANTISARDWNHKKLSPVGWLICLIINIACVLIFQQSGVIPSGTPIGQLVIILLCILTLVVFVAQIQKKNQVNTINTNVFLNTLSVITVLVFSFTAVFSIGTPITSNTSTINDLSLKIISAYTVVLALLLVGYRTLKKKEIPV